MSLAFYDGVVMKKKNIGIILAGLAGLLFAVILFSVAFGSVRIPIRETVAILASKLPFVGSSVDVSFVDSSHEFIVWNLRLPRILIACFVGAVLSMTGVSFQAVFNNPMAEPYIMGVSSGAAFGATVAIILGFSGYAFGLAIVSIFAFCGAMAATFFVFQLGKIGGKISTVSVLLSGVVLGAVLSAVINFMMMIHRDELERIVMWTLGSFSASGWEHVRISFLPFCSGFVVLMLKGRELNALVMGEELAQSMGVDVERTKWTVLLLSSLLAAIAVSVSGIIGFVGLIVPHFFRLVVGSDHRRLMPAVMFGGAAFLVICDTLSRSLMETQEVPVGILTSFLGGPFFLYLLRKAKKTATGGN